MEIKLFEFKNNRNQSLIEYKYNTESRLLSFIKNSILIHFLENKK